MGSNPTYGSDFSEFPMGSINISFHMFVSFSNSLLFLLYINDLPNCLSFSQPRIYADDTSLTFAIV